MRRFSEFLSRVFRRFKTLGFIFELEVLAVRGQKEHVVGLPLIARRRSIALIVVEAGADLFIDGLPQQRRATDAPQISLQPRVDLAEIGLVSRELFNYALRPASLMASARSL